MRPLITSLLDGELAAPERHALETHLASCGTCRQEMEAVMALRGTWREARAPAPEAADRIRILEAARPLLEQYASSGPGRRAPLGLSWPADFVTAGALAVSLVLVIVLLHGEPAARHPSAPVYTLEERRAQETRTPLEAGEVIHLKGIS